jgi:hypothetical protein
VGWRVVTDGSVRPACPGRLGSQTWLLAPCVRPHDCRAASRGGGQGPRACSQTRCSMRGRCSGRSSAVRTRCIRAPPHSGRYATASFVPLGRRRRTLPCVVGYSSLPSRSGCSRCPRGAAPPPRSRRPLRRSSLHWRSSCGRSRSGPICRARLPGLPLTPRGPSTSSTDRRIRCESSTATERRSRSGGKRLQPRPVRVPRGR